MNQMRKQEKMGSFSESGLRISRFLKVCLRIITDREGMMQV